MCLWLGYISNVFSTKTSKDQKSKYFSFTLANYVISYNGVCFSFEKYKLFTNVAQEGKSNNGTRRKIEQWLRNKEI